MDLLGRLRERRRERDDRVERACDMYPDLAELFRRRPYLMAALVQRAETMIANRMDRVPDDVCLEQWERDNADQLTAEITTGFGLEAFIAAIVAKLIVELIKHVRESL